MLSKGHDEHMAGGFKPEVNFFIARAIYTCFLLGALLDYFSQTITADKNFFGVLMLAALAVCVEIVIRSKLEIKKTIRALSIIIALFIPCMVLSFQLFDSIIIWSLSFLIMIVSLASVDSTMILCTAVSSVTTQLYVWYCVHGYAMGGYGPECLIGVLLFGGMIAAIIIERRCRTTIGYNLNQFAQISKQQQEISELYEELAVSQRELARQNEKIVKINELIHYDEEINRTVLETISEGIWYWDAYQDKAFFSQRLKQIAGCEDLDLDRWRSFTHPEDSDKLETAIEDHIALKTKSFKSVYRIMPNPGDVRWIKEKGKALFDDAGKPYFMVGAVNDITDLKQHEDMLNVLAYHDILTGLPNRMLFFDKLGHTVRQATQNDGKFAVLFIDLDNFKRVNDSQGHFAGDALIEEVALRLKNSIDDRHILGRFGGDEFALAIKDIDSTDDVLEVVRNIKRCLHEPFEIGGRKVFVNASFGIAIFPKDGEEPAELIRNADTAMYRAKDLGKNHVQFFEKSMEEEIVRKTELEYKLKNAILDEEMFLLFQPQIIISSGAIRGFEALLRWENPSLGIVSPLEFIPVAEETGLIFAIGEWVLKNACLTVKKWHDQYGVKPVISVNISPAQLRDDNFIAIVQKILTESELPPACLELEITESVCIDDVDDAVSILNELKQMGVKISLDDFGTGFSSLSYLKLLPIDTLKIDKSFIDNLNNSAENKIVRAVISLVHQLDIVVIAEGVETNAQLEYLQGKNCDYAQGYLLGRPVKGSDVKFE